MLLFETRDRLRHAWRLAKSVRKPVVILAAGALGLLGALQAVRDELPEDSRAWLQVRSWLPDLSFQAWIVVLLVAAFLILFEASYRNHDQRQTVDYDPRKPKQFTNRTPREFFQMFEGATTAERKAAFEPHVGLWLAIEGAVSDLDVRDDGWVVVTVDFALRSKEHLLPEPPKLVHLYFYGEDAKVAKAYRKGDSVSARGMIHESFDWFGGLNLVPAELTRDSSPLS